MVSFSFDMCGFTYSCFAGMFDIAFMSENDYAVVQILWVQVPLEKSSPQSEGTVCTLVLSSAYLVNAVRTPQSVRP